MAGTPPARGSVVEPEVQKLAIAALVGLLFLFPVFNQVQASSLEALRDADHQAKFKDFIKDWDDIPEDEKLSYWDGRNKPPGDGDFDRDDIDDDATIHQPTPGEPQPGDRDGDGVPDEEDPNPDDPRVTDQVRERWHEVVLWQYRGSGTGNRQTAVPIEAPADADRFAYINISHDYAGFTGAADFSLFAGGERIWDLQVRTAGVYSVQAEDRGFAERPDQPREPLEITYDYDPLSSPDAFEVEVTGAYVVYESVATTS